MSHFVAAQEMRTNVQWGFKFKPGQWLAATQIKSWLSARWSEQKAAAKMGGGALDAFLAQEAGAVQAAAADAERSGSESGEWSAGKSGSESEGGSGSGSGSE